MSGPGSSKDRRNGRSGRVEEETVISPRPWATGVQRVGDVGGGWTRNRPLLGTHEFSVYRGFRGPKVPSLECRRDTVPVVECSYGPRAPAPTPGSSTQRQNKKQK